MSPLPPREDTVVESNWPCAYRRGNLGGRVDSCPPNYNIGWAANVFCPPEKFSQHISSRPNKQTKRYRPTVLYSTNRKLRSTSTCRIESTHPPNEKVVPALLHVHPIPIPSNTRLSGPTSLSPNRFSRFCTVQLYAQQTYRPENEQHWLE